MDAQLEKTLTDLLSRMSFDNWELCPNGSEYSLSNKSRGFFLFVPADATTVHFETWGGQNNTFSLAKGLYPCKVKRVFSDNASVVYAMY